MATIPAVDMVGGQSASLYSDIAASFDVASPGEPKKDKKPKKS